MLQAVTDHTDQSHRDRDRGIPPTIHYAVEFGDGELVDVFERREVHIAVVVGEQLRVRVDFTDLAAAVPVSDVGGGEREVEPILPSP